MKVIGVLPAHNAQETLELTLDAIPENTLDEIILVDDKSTDDTYEIAKKRGLYTIRHEENKGYGANQKTCYKKALDLGADIVVMIHPDYQYDPRITPFMVGVIKNDICDVMLGNRIRTRQEALSGGMPVYKFMANRFLTGIENAVTGQNLGEWHSGLRAYSRKVLETIPWENNSDDFVFDAQFLLQAAIMGFRIGDLPVSAKYFKEASSINLRRSIRYGFSSLYYLAQYSLHSNKIIHAAIFEPKKR